MLQFVFSYSERTPRNGHTHKTVQIARIIAGKPVILGSYTETFVSAPDQLVLNALHAFKQHGRPGAKNLPHILFEKSQFGGWKRMLCNLRAEGIANFVQL